MKKIERIEVQVISRQVQTMLSIVGSSDAGGYMTRPAAVKTLRENLYALSKKPLQVFDERLPEVVNSLLAYYSKERANHYKKSEYGVREGQNRLQMWMDICSEAGIDLH